MHRVRREKEEVFSGMRSPPGKGSLQPVAVEAAAEVTKLSEPSTQRSPSGRPASVQAVTQVNSRWGLEMGNAGADPTRCRGRLPIQASVRATLPP